MAALVVPFIASLSRTRDNRRGEPLGSGVYLKLRGARFLLTCEHELAKGYASGYRLAHLPKAGGNYYACQHPWISKPWPVDLGLTCIDPPLWQETDRSEAALEMMAERYAPAEHELLFVAGHPGEMAAFQDIPGDVILKSDRVLYLARESPLPRNFDPVTHFAVQYEMKAAQTTDGGRRKLPAPPGLSGSAIWDTGFGASGYDANWNAESARLVGVAQKWVPSESCIICVKAEALRSFLLEGVRGYVAYQRWIEQGRPTEGISEEDALYADSVVMALE